MSEAPAVLWIPGRLPDLNTIINAKLNVFVPPAMRAQPFMPAKLPNEWSKVKKRWHDIIDRLCTEQGFDCPASGYFNYFLIEENKRRDKDNVGAGAQKVIQDALVKRGSLYNDGWKTVLGYRHFFAVDADRSGVFLVVTQKRCLTDDEALLFVARSGAQISLFQDAKVG
jgi:hypothetical protein